MRTLSKPATPGVDPNITLNAQLAAAAATGTPLSIGRHVRVLVKLSPRGIRITRSNGL